jgi:hypothetical protein
VGYGAIRSGKNQWEFAAHDAASRYGPASDQHDADAVGGRCAAGEIGPSWSADVCLGWQRYAGGAGEVPGTRSFGISAAMKNVARQFGFTTTTVAAEAKRAIGHMN